MCPRTFATGLSSRRLTTLPSPFIHAIEGHHRLRKRYVVALRKLGGMISHFAVPDAVAALTFDDGPHPQYTPPLLEILNTFNVRATFFLVGTSAAQYPDLVRQIAHAGHAIGNHSWDHKATFTSLSRKERRKQIRQCQQAIAPYGSRIFRPPWGARNTGVLLDALCLRYKLIGWNLDVQDWRSRIAIMSRG